MNVLIIEDDPMVASLNHQFVTRVYPNALVNSVQKIELARQLVKGKKVDLLLLDVYLPDMLGTDFLLELYRENISIPVILITAADDHQTVKHALDYRVIDYLIKPFTFERFKVAFDKFLALHQVSQQSGPTTQATLDKFFNHQVDEPVNQFKLQHLPKGLSRPTLTKVVQQVDIMHVPFSTEELAKLIDLSRISTKKYILFLLQIGYLQETMEYREIGRPITLYLKNQEHEKSIQDYI
ncbi:response regulator [Vagococcus penaei]|uniref:Transcriptional regulatory protein n=1 Tax=Vagococcus penaei TaxID=633807 RepID=A0A1Q2D4U2_9ENTE|nr:response regulator [Vagococcus penaei]AQP53379.1 response regulator [Vagococcus penaei]RST99702.1 response regulator [Vagococcus penaei]